MVDRDDSKTNTDEVLMLMLGEHMRIGVVAGHVPVKDIPASVTEENILNKIRILNKSLLEDFAIRKAKIAVLGLNPHAGDGGLIGHEEADEIAPAIKQAKEEGIDATGPVPGDTVYVRALQGEFDGVVSMYHDQALAAMKAAGFGKIVIILAHCPIIITTPSHGSAFNIAGKGIADHKNMLDAIEVAAGLAQRRKQAEK